MKLTWTSFLFLVAATLGQGETFIGPTTATNRLLVSSNSAIVITATFGDFTNSTQVKLDGGASFAQGYFAPLEHGRTYAVAGPAELIFSNAVLFTFYRITNSAIHSLGIANDPLGLTIASNKTMHVFAVPGSINANFSRAGSAAVSFTIEPNTPAEFTGPGLLSLSSGVFPPYAKFLSYYFAEDGFVLPGQRAIAGPIGSYGITVEKSYDLATWSPVLVQNSADEARAFFRLRIER